MSDLSPSERGHFTSLTASSRKLLQENEKILRTSNNEAEIQQASRARIKLKEEHSRLLDAELAYIAHSDEVSDAERRLGQSAKRMRQAVARLQGIADVLNGLATMTRVVDDIFAIFT